MENYIEQKISEITEKIVDEVSPEKIILFGSHAWGKPGPDSDIDLFVIQKSNESRRTRQLRIRKLFLDFDLPADALSYTPEEIRIRLDMGDLFVRKILDRGKIVYEQK